MWKIEYTISETRKEKLLRILIENTAELVFMVVVQYNWGQKCLIFPT